jgi:transglutaminase-like putative cysteine protease
MPVFKIQHITRYEYDRPVREGVNQIKVYPYERLEQSVMSHQLHISTDPLLHQFKDYWGNTTGLFTISNPHQVLEIDSRLIVRTTLPTNNPLTFSKPYEWHMLKEEVGRSMQLLDLTSPGVLESKAIVSDLVNDLRPFWDAPAMFLQRCSEYIYEKFEYRKGITNIETTVDEILEHRQGVCQDFAHVMLQMLRSVGIPARYVSGYICPNRDGVRGAGATHAWVEAWLPSVSGWVGIDPTNNMWVSEQHVSLAVGRHFNDCTPVKGTFKGPANHALSVYVSVGYEDGTSFEDRNQVQLSQQEPIVAWVDYESGQQQQ